MKTKTLNRQERDILEAAQDMICLNHECDNCPLFSICKTINEVTK